MHFVIHFTIALISLIAIVLSCVLFTNGVEFLGNKLKIGNCATGSILAVLGTGLPEFIVPLVAIFGANYTNTPINTAQNIALGAILGSPFMLSTLALFILAFVLIIKKRNKINAELSFVLRDYKYFILAYVVAILFSFKALNDYKIFAAIILFILYGVFVFRTILKSKCTCFEAESEKLYLNIKNENLALFLQLSTSLLILILSSHFFVNEIKYFSLAFGVSPSILALLITPFATELPECINSIIWLKEDKDELAISNILGAVVFQASLLFSIGMILTSFEFSFELLFNSILTILCALIFLLSILKTQKITLLNLFICGIFYISYLIFLICK